MSLEIVSNLCELIGNTPILKLKRFTPPGNAEIWAKLEAFNPGSSVKDRIALSMIETAEKEGLLEPGSTIIEPTSGNTGIGLAWVAAIKGYRIIIVMPESMSVERRKILVGFGAELVLTDGDKGMEGAIEQAEYLKSQIPKSFMPQQFMNKANPAIHYNTTGPEIWQATEGKIDIFIAGVGTGGTISGAGKYLKEKKPEIKIVAVEPEESAVLSGQEAGPHMIQGIGAGFVPDIYDGSVVDEVIRVISMDAINTAKQLAQKEGLLAGISSGASAYAARLVAEREENKDKLIVAILPDTGERYVSTLLFYED